MVISSVRQEAPGRLEQVRELLNTWSIPNDTREATDVFQEFAAESGMAEGERADLRQLRDDLRIVVERSKPADELISAWIARLRVRTVVRNGELAFDPVGDRAGAVLAAVLDSIADGTWARLKACPDCRWVFYDHTRNGGKRWCMMNADGSGGRGCGTIAKVRRYRARQS